MDSLQGTLWSPITLSDDSTLTPYSLPPPYRTPPIFPYPAFNDPTRRNENQIQFPPMGRDVTPWTNLDHQVDFGIDIDPFLRDYVFAAMESNVGQAQHTVTQLCRAAEVLAQMLVNQSTQTPTARSGSAVQQDVQISAVAIATPPPEPKSTLSSPLTRGWDLITHNIPQAHRRKDADGPNDPIVRFLGLARVALFDQCGIQAEDYQFLDRIRFLSEGRFKIDLADYDSSTLTIYAFIGGERAVWVALDKDVWHKAVVSPDGSRQSSKCAGTVWEVTVDGGKAKKQARDLAQAEGVNFKANAGDMFFTVAASRTPAIDQLRPADRFEDLTPLDIWTFRINQSSRITPSRRGKSFDRNGRQNNLGLDM